MNLWPWKHEVCFARLGASACWTRTAPSMVMICSPCGAPSVTPHGSKPGWVRDPPTRPARVDDGFQPSFHGDFMGYQWDIDGIYKQLQSKLGWYHMIPQDFWRHDPSISQCQGYEDDVWGWRWHVSERGEVGEVSHLHPVPWQVWQGQLWEDGFTLGDVIRFHGMV